MQENTIPAWQYFRDNSVNEFTVPDSVSRIENHAFYDCHTLKHITFPEHPVRLEKSTFMKCSALKEITLPRDLKEIPSELCSGCLSLDQVIIPESVEAIQDRAFYYCTNLKEIKFPDSVRSIGNSTFERCTGLKSVTLPESISHIGMKAFAGCWNLTHARLPEKLTSVPKWAFADCWFLQTINLPEQLTELGEGAFMNCVSLKSIRLPASLTEIPENAFLGCSGLNQLHIPEHIQKIHNHAFSCTRLQKLAIHDTTECGSSGLFDHIRLLHLYRNGCHVRIELNEKKSTDETLLIRFWTEKNLTRRKIFFRQLKNPAYKIPLAVLMTFTLDEDCSVFRQYVQKNFDAVSQFLTGIQDEDNIEKLLQMKDHLNQEEIRMSVKTQIVQAINDYVKEFGNDTVMTSGEVQKLTGLSFLPSDFSYNCYNTGLGDFSEWPHLFEKTDRGMYRILGENYSYTGEIYHKPKGEPEKIVGHWENGKLYMK